MGSDGFRRVQGFKHEYNEKNILQPKKSRVARVKNQVFGDENGSNRNSFAKWPHSNVLKTS
jgi:hypothetical protein